uniref:Uncharacterized protein LOC104219284 n=1 Tax=Nicotiana sylvestris TaxID=4096 RepID=A0A1U7W1V9_NICSY|nr:PREDICTED: uncharacterized protein LOC104219284 [Nicotiana sylvestris]
MVKQRGRGAKQPDRGESSRDGKGKLVKLTPQARQNIKNKSKAIKAADSAYDQSGSEYMPSQDISSDSVPTHFVSKFGLTDDSPPPSPPAQDLEHIHSESSEGLAVGNDDYSISPTASLFGESADVEDEGDEEVTGGDLLFEDPAPAVVPAAEPQQEQTQRPPKKNRKLPILAAEQKDTGNQSEVPVHTEDSGTTDDPMQTDTA